MARLKILRDIPPGGWHYTERETGVRFDATSLEGLVEQATIHRRYKGLPTENLREIIEEQICLGLSCNECVPNPGENYRPVKNLTNALTTDMAISANKALVAFVKGGLEFNDPTQAKARADVCRTCPFNTPASGCSCHAIYRMIDLMIPSARKQPGISVCMACGCSLQAKVNLPDKVVTESLDGSTVFPPWCWQNSLQPLDAPKPA